MGWSFGSWVERFLYCGWIVLGLHGNYLGEGLVICMVGIFWLTKFSFLAKFGPLNSGQFFQPRP